MQIITDSSNFRLTRWYFQHSFHYRFLNFVWGTFYRVFERSSKKSEETFTYFLYIILLAILLLQLLTNNLISFFYYYKNIFLHNNSINSLYNWIKKTIHIFRLSWLQQVISNTICKNRTNISFLMKIEFISLCDTSCYSIDVKIKISTHKK